MGALKEAVIRDRAQDKAMSFRGRAAEPDPKVRAEGVETYDH
jgi:hypothetical protein